MARYQNVEVEVWRTGRRYPRWIGQMLVDGSNVCGNEFWPMVWAFTERSAERRIRRIARRHRRKWLAVHATEQLKLEGRRFAA